MTHKPQPVPQLFHVDVSADPQMNGRAGYDTVNNDVLGLLRDLVEGQERQIHVLEELSEQLNASQRQRATELGQWKQANPDLARGCRQAAEALTRVQTEFLQNLIDDVTDSADCLMDSDFMLNEFVDRYGPRLAHLNGVLQVLSQLSSVPNPTNTTQ